MLIAVFAFAGQSFADYSFSFSDVRPNHHVPFMVRYDFRAMGSDGLTVNWGLDSEYVTWSIYENDNLIDPDESEQFITSGECLPLKIALVLDFTRSMSNAGAIEPMRSAAVSFIRSPNLTSAHHMAIMAYWDRQGRYGVLEGAEPWKTYLNTAGKDKLAEIVQNCDPHPNGASQIWDTLKDAIDMFQREPLPGEVRCIVFLTDGRDTSSVTNIETLIQNAQHNGVKLYPFGFGHDIRVDVLQQLANQTGGEYHYATEASELEEAFARLVHNLGGFWALTYTTLKPPGVYNLRAVCEPTLPGYSGDTITGSFNAGDLQGDTYVGKLALNTNEEEMPYDDAANETRVRLKAEYIPREISEFAFAFTGPVKGIELLETGGICPSGDWTVDNEGSGKFHLYKTSGYLKYGLFGDMFDVIVDGAPDDFKITVSCDNSIYPSGQSFAIWPNEAGSGGANLSVGITTDKRWYEQGDTITVSVSAANEGSRDAQVDVYIGLIASSDLWCYTVHGWSLGMTVMFNNLSIPAGIHYGPSGFLTLRVPSRLPSLQIIELIACLLCYCGACCVGRSFRVCPLCEMRRVKKGVSPRRPFAAGQSGVSRGFIPLIAARSELGEMAFAAPDSPSEDGG